MTTYKLSFGSYVFPATVRPDGGSADVDLAEQELPRQDGSVTQVGRAKSRLLQVRGDLYGDTPAQLWAALDSLRAACALGTSARLFFGRDDRYYDAQVETFADSYTEGLLWGSVATVAIGFRAARPYALATAPDTINFPANGSPWTLDPSGDSNAGALPAWTLTIGTAGTGPLTLSNQTTGEVCSLAGPFAAGDVILLNRDGYTVTLNGAPNFGLLSGRIPRLVPGTNTLSLTAGGTATVSAFSVTYTPRWA